MNEFVQLSDGYQEIGDIPVGLSNIIFGFACAGASALGLLATSVLAFLAPPAVLNTKSTAPTGYGHANSNNADDAPHLRLISRTSRPRKSAPQGTIMVSAPAPRLANVVQMQRVAAIVEDATTRSVTLRQLHERTRTQIDAAEQALISLRNELAAIIPAHSAPSYTLLAA